MRICIFWRSSGENMAFSMRFEPLQNIVGKYFTFRTSAPSMRQKMSSFCEFLKCNKLNIRRLILKNWLWNFLYFPQVSLNTL